MKIGDTWEEIYDCKYILDIYSSLEDSVSFKIHTDKTLEIAVMSGFSTANAKIVSNLYAYNNGEPIKLSAVFVDINLNAYIIDETNNIYTFDLRTMKNLTGKNNAEFIELKQVKSYKIYEKENPSFYDKFIDIEYSDGNKATFEILFYPEYASYLKYSIYDISLFVQ